MNRTPGQLRHKLKRMIASLEKKDAAGKAALEPHIEKVRKQLEELQNDVRSRQNIQR